MYIIVSRGHSIQLRYETISPARTAVTAMSRVSRLVERSRPPRLHHHLPAAAVVAARGMLWAVAARVHIGSIRNVYCPSRWAYQLISQTTTYTHFNFLCVAIL